jgi:hypothetical protein
MADHRRLGRLVPPCVATTKGCEAMMDQSAITAWALKNGWQMLGGHLSLTNARQPKAPIVRMILKTTVVNVEIKKPAGSKWEKVGGAAYADIQPDPDTGVPRGLGLVSIGGLAALMQENADRAMMARTGP